MAEDSEGITAKDSEPVITCRHRYVTFIHVPNEGGEIIRGLLVVGG